MTIYSFDDVIRMTKRLHAIPLTPTGDYSIPLPRPVPWIGFAYFVVIEFFFVLAAKVPVLDILSQTFAPLAYYIAFPIGVVWLAFKVELDGRKPHLWAISYLFYLRRDKRRLAGRVVAADGTKTAYKGRVKIWWDLNAPRLQRGWVHGGKVTTTVPVRFTHAIIRHHSQVIVPDDGGRPADHEVKGKLEVRS